MKGGCRPCDQPHFFLGDTPTTKIDHGLLVADYPVKDWRNNKPKPLEVKAGEQVMVTGTYSINSMGGFAASDGLIIHKKLQDAAAARSSPRATRFSRLTRRPSSCKASPPSWWAARASTPRSPASKK